MSYELLNDNSQRGIPLPYVFSIPAHLLGGTASDDVTEVIILSSTERKISKSHT